MDLSVLVVIQIVCFAVCLLLTGVTFPDNLDLSLNIAQCALLLALLQKVKGNDNTSS